MRRLSWDLLKKEWAELFFYDSLLIFLTRLHEDKGRKVKGVIIFDPFGKNLPPRRPPLHIAVLYSEDCDFIRDNLALRRFIDDAMVEVFSYGMEQFKRMVRFRNPFALSIMKGIVIYKGPDDLKELESI